MVCQILANGLYTTRNSATKAGAHCPPVRLGDKIPSIKRHAAEDFAGMCAAGKLAAEVPDFILPKI
jgi:hypothetical protein